MAICEYQHCRKEFEPNPRNRTNNIQRFCDARCRVKAWEETHPKPTDGVPDVPDGLQRSNLAPDADEGGQDVRADEEEIQAAEFRARIVYGKMRTAIKVMEQEHRQLTTQVSRQAGRDCAHAMHQFDVSLRRLKDLIESWHFHELRPEQSQTPIVPRYEGPGIEVAGTESKAYRTTEGTTRIPIRCGTVTEGEGDPPLGRIWICLPWRNASTWDRII
jgi:hypothetical protein